jgi:aerobic carbon-monoxide dehydrogenase medium subunit
LRPPELSYVRARSLAEAVTLLVGDEVAAVAGGQSLVPMLSLRVAGARRLIDIARLPELAGVQGSAEAVTIGAATTHAMLEDGIEDDPSRGMLAHVAGGIAYRAVRHFGTVGGALCLADPAADWPVCLMALGATLHVVGPDGARDVAARDFVLGAYTTALRAGEVLRAVSVKRLRQSGSWGWAKLARKQGAYADSLAAAVRRDASSPPEIVLGATGRGAVRLPGVVDAVRTAGAVGTAGLEEAIRAAVTEADPDADAIRLRWHAANVGRAVARMLAA